MYGDQFREFAFGYWGFGAVGLGAVFHLGIQFLTFQKGLKTEFQDGTQGVFAVFK